MHKDIIIVGAGISGIAAGYNLQKSCPDKSFAILEGREALGGTWDLFKYPGVRSDSDMHTLGFRFKPWIHKRSIADGPSILKYLNETVDDYNLRDKISYNQKVNFQIRFQLKRPDPRSQIPHFVLKKLYE